MPDGNKALSLDWVEDRAMWDDIRAAVLPRVAKLFREAFLTGAEMGAMQRPARERAERALDEAAEIVERGLRDIGPGEQTVLPYDFDAINGAADSVIQSYTDEWWSQFSQGTQQQMRRIIQRASSLGLGVEDVTRELTPLFGAARAQRIAVNELTNLLGMGANETYRQAGFPSWRWATVKDAQVDEICRRLSGRVFPISQPFRRAHFGCRCYSQPYGRVAVPPGLVLPGL